MKLYRAHDGLALALPAPPAASATLDDLYDCLSLATGIASDNIICMAADGSQLHHDNYAAYLALDDDAGLELFIYDRECLSADAPALAQQLALPTHLEQGLSHIDELPEPGSPHYAAAVLPWALHALSLIRTHASRAQLAHAALTNMHRASAIALANLLQYQRTISAGADALNASVGAELARMKDLLDGYERDLRILGMVPIEPRLLNPSSRDSTANARISHPSSNAPQPGSSQSPASTPSSQGHGVPAPGAASTTAAGPSKRLGDYVSRQRMSAVAAACARVHAELAARFVEQHNKLHALQLDVRALESEVHSVDLGPVADSAEAAREARQRAEDIVEHGLVPWLSGAFLGNEQEYQHLLQDGLLPPFPLAPVAPPPQASQPAVDVGTLPDFRAEHDQDRLHTQLEEALTELVLLDEVTRASVLRLSQDRNDMQARIITFLQDIAAVQIDLGELAEKMDAFEREEMPPGAGLRQSIKAQQLVQAQAQAALAQAKAAQQQQQQQQQSHHLQGLNPSLSGTPIAGAQQQQQQQQLYIGTQPQQSTNTLTATTAGGDCPRLGMGAFVIDGFRPSLAPVVAAAAGAGTGIGAPAPGSASATSSSTAGTQQGNSGAGAGGAAAVQIRTDNFRHLARLHHMLLAYGATLIELVRRATFSRLFLKSAQSVAELMALVSEREVERRKEWRKAGVSALLPWDVRALSLVPMSGSGGGGMLAASALGDEGTPALEISTKGMRSLHGGGGGGTGASSSGAVDPLAAALAAAAELGRDDVDRLFALLDDIERALDQEAELARESQTALAMRRRSSALRQHSTGGFALAQGQRSPATPPQQHPGSALQSPTGGAVQGLPLIYTNPVPEVRAALQMLVEEIDDMEPEFRDLVNVTLLERKSRFRRRRASRRTGNGTFDQSGGAGVEADETQTSDAEDDDEYSDEDETDASAVNGNRNGGRRNGAAAAPSSRRALRKQLKELHAKTGEAEASAASAQASLEAAQAENSRLRAQLAQLSEESHAAHAAIRSELENVRAESRSNAEAYDRARHARDDALAQADALRNDVDTEAARRLNLEEEITNARRDLKEARREAAESKREALEMEERLGELEVQTSELQHELDNAVRAREDVCKRMEGLLHEGSGAERELASAQARIEELNREVSAARTEVREAKEALAEAENARDKLIRTYRAEADGDRAILEENVRNKEQELRLAKEGLKNAETARKAAEAREAAERTVSDGLRGQLEAADVAHETLLRELEEAREDGSRASNERDELLRLVRPLMGKIQVLRKIIRAMPTPSSSSRSADKEREGDHSISRERSSSSSLSVTGEAVNGGGSNANRSGSGAQGSSSSTATVKPSSLLNVAMEAFESEGENSASLAVTLAALRALEPRLFHDEVKGKLDALTILVRKWQKAYKSAQEKITRAQASARDRIAYRNFQVGDLVLFLPTRNTSSRTFAAFNRGYPHYFLRAEGAFGEHVRSKDYLLDRITAVTERVAGAAVGGAPLSGDGSADGTNPYQLAEGVRYHILDVEGALTSGVPGSSGPPQTPTATATSRAPGAGAMPPRSVSHGPPTRRDSSAVTSPRSAHSNSTTASAAASPPGPSGALVPVGPVPLAIPPTSAASSLSSTAAAAATAPSGSVLAQHQQPSGLTLSRSTSRSFDRLTAKLGESTEQTGTAGGSTATITPLGAVPTPHGGPSPVEGGVPVPAFGTRAPRPGTSSANGGGGGGLKRRAPGDVSVDSAGGPSSSGSSVPGAGVTPAAPMPISIPRGSSGHSSVDAGEGDHPRHLHQFQPSYLQLANYDRSFGAGPASRDGAGSSNAGPTNMVPTAADFERGLKDARTSRAIAEALAAEGLANIGNPFSASPSGVGSLLERNNSFGGRGSSSSPVVGAGTGGGANGPGLPASSLRTGSTTSRQRRQAGASSSSSSGSNLSRARREGGAFRRIGAAGAGSGLATPVRTGFYPARGGLSSISSAGGANSASVHSPASPALAVESLATARGETSLLASSGGGAGRSESPLWRTDSQTSLRLGGAGSPRLGVGGRAGPSSRPSTSSMASAGASPSPSGRMGRQLSSGAGSGSGSGFSDIPPARTAPGDAGLLGLHGARSSNASTFSQPGGGSDISFPRSRTHTGSTSIPAAGSSSGGGGGGGGTLGRSSGGTALRKDSFGSGFLSSLTFGRASARKHSLQGPQTRTGAPAADEGASSLSSTVTPGVLPRRSTLEVILGWPSGSTVSADGASASGAGGDAKGKRAVRGSVSEGGGGVLVSVDEGGAGGSSGFEVGSPGSEAGSATAAEMLRRLARS